MPRPHRARPRQLHNHQAYGSQPDPQSARQRLSARAAQGRCLGRRVPRKPHQCRLTPSPDCPADGLESDDFDSHSVHSILTHNATGNPIGTVRLILPDENGERRMLPMRRIAGAVAIDDVAPFPVWRTAEISRFSIVKSFRHYTPNQGFDAQLSAEEWRKMLFHLPLGLIKSCVEMSVREGMTHWATVMEPALLRLLTRLGIHFNPLGSLVEYHGRRQPCWVDLDIMLARVHAERPDVWEVITDGGRLWPLPEVSSTEAADVTVDDVIAAQAMPERRVAMR